MSKIIQLGFATANPHKLKETEACLKHLDPRIQLIALRPSKPVEETGSTFLENAQIKLQAALSGALPKGLQAVFAEDAGLIVEALDGLEGLSPFPGVRSDRWLSEALQQQLFGKVSNNPDYLEKNKALLQLMEGKANRNAYYEATLAVYDCQDERLFHVAGQLDLQVAQIAVGENGFGYDPIMIPTNTDRSRTMAQLTLDEKNQISHRFHALKALCQAL